jgi:TRAP-type C4-dicarboxylate transport system substrate-binding protein/DNA-binding XRE family transcriptional regulator
MNRANTIGTRVRAARKSLNLRQADLADRVGMAGSHLSDIERGVLMPTIPTLEKISEALNRPLEYFFSVTSDQPRALGTVIFRVSIGDLSARRFAELVYEKTGGELSIQIYHQPTSDTYELVKGLVEGSIHIFIDDLSSLDRYAPLCSVVLQPYFFRDAAHYDRFLKSALFQREVREKLLANGIRILNPLINHEQHAVELLFSRAPVFTPADLIGRKYRSYASDVADAVRRELGAEPVRVIWNRSVDAFEQGTIDLFLMPARHYTSLDLHSVARYSTVIDYGYAANMVIAINDREYNKLAPGLQQVLLEAVEETERHFSAAVAAHTSHYLTQLPIEHGVPVIQPDQSIWRERYSSALRTICLNQGYLAPDLYEELQAL